MITVLGMWERWEAPTLIERMERRLWKQTIQAFGVDAWAMCGVYGGPFTSPTQHVDLDAMLASHPGPKTFLLPPGRIDGSLDLATYDHPEDAIYVFGRGGENLVRHVTPDDDAVSIFTPSPDELFGNGALVAVLYDRMVKA